MFQSNTISSSLNPDNIWILIPSYQPQPVLIDLVKAIYETGIKHLILVDDGSDDKQIFEQLAKEFSQLKLISYKDNKGKGGALKEGYKYFIDSASDNSLIVSMDADGQHAIDDALRLAQAHNDNSYTLGVRNFDNDIPLRSKIGNKFTRFVTRLSKGINLTDTQTGLRAVSKPLAKKFLHIPLNSYAFEFECLSLAKNTNHIFTEVPIKTIYIDENSSSHFNPLLDSIKIYWSFVKFAVIAVISVAIDFALFYLFEHFLGNGILSATLLARTISSAFNFFANKYITFEKKDKSSLVKEALGYAILATIVAFISGYGVDYVNSLQLWHVMLTKIIVDGGLFIANYIILKRFIFKV